jgi:O-antigen/teichoic acid export membrane protein
MSSVLQLFRNVSSNYLKVGIDGVIAIVLTPYIVQELGVAQYAVWIIVNTLGYYLGFFDLGVSDAQVQRHSVLQARGATEELGQLHGTVLVFFAAAGALAFAVSVGLAALPSAEVFDVPVELRNEFTLVLPLIGLTVLISFVDAAFAGVFEGYQRYDLMNFIDIVLAVLEAIATYVVLSAGYGMTGVAAVLAVGAFAALLVKAVVARFAFPAYAFPKLGFRRNVWRDIRGFSLWNSLTDLVTEGTANFDKLLIPVLLGSALVTPYSLVLTVAALVFVVAEPITETFFPIAARRHGRGDRGALAALLVRGSRLVNVATLPVAAVVLCFGTAILDIWIGEALVDVEPSVLWFTVLSFWFSTYLWTSLSLLMGAGQARMVFWTSLLEVGFVLALLLALAPRLGLTGFALAGLVANVAIGLAFFTRRACTLASMPHWRFLRATLLVPLGAAAPAFVLGLWLARTVNPQTLPSLLLCVAITALAGGLGVGVVAAGRWQRGRYFVALQRVLRRRNARAA